MGLFELVTRRTVALERVLGREPGVAAATANAAIAELERFGIILARANERKPGRVFRYGEHLGLLMPEG